MCFMCYVFYILDILSNIGVHTDIGLKIPHSQALDLSILRSTSNLTHIFIFHTVEQWNSGV